MKISSTTARPWYRCTPAFGLCLALTLPFNNAALAHFQELIPSLDIVDAGSGRAISLDLRFTHPMAGGPVMEMAAPRRFAVLGPDGEQDLRPSLRPIESQGASAWRADFRFRQPGDHVFFVEPQPYWEPAEGKMIVHYTKVVVDAFAGEPRWDTRLNLPVEIEPLVRPYGLWTGNLFRGIVHHQGRVVPFAEVEVEWRNDGSLQLPADAFATQIIKADANGSFSYAMPRAGWWGFAALVEAEQPMTGPNGESVPVELGGLIWVHVRDMR